MPFVVGLAEYLWKRPADIFLFVIKFFIFKTKFIKQSTLLYLLWSDILRRCIFYACCLLCFIEAHIVPKRQIKKVYLSVFGRYRYKIKFKDDILHIEAATFCVLQYIQKILYYSEILSGINTYFEQVYERHSSCDFECNLFFFIRAKYEPSFLEKIIFYRQWFYLWSSINSQWFR
jgi:hypothetical protein